MEKNTQQIIKDLTDRVSRLERFTARLLQEVSDLRKENRRLKASAHAATNSIGSLNLKMRRE